MPREAWKLFLSMRFPLRFLVVMALIFGGANALAQCVNAATPSCGVYASCFAKYCPCEGSPSEYFLTYGEKYCKAFLTSTDFSEAGQKWRDSTLICLQEAIVPHLDIAPNPQCNCTSMRRTAFDSHVGCYTQAGASICDLPAGDITAIGATLDLKDLFDAQGWRQMRDIAAVCSVSAPEDGRRAVWKGFAATLKLRSP